MQDLKLSDIMNMQKELQDKYKNKWTPLTPEKGRNSLLWVVEELGEAASIIKKCGDDAIMNDPLIRAAFLEELVDLLMFYNDTLMSYDFTAYDLSEAFIKKHNKNMKRDFDTRAKKFRESIGRAESGDEDVSIEQA